MVYILIVSYLVTPFFGPPRMSQKLAAFKTVESCYQAASRYTDASKTQCLEVDLR